MLSSRKLWVSDKRPIFVMVKANITVGIFSFLRHHFFFHFLNDKI
jgi:hypothetical protein